MRRLLLCSLCCGLLGCTSPPAEPERTWRPSDHGEPPSLAASEDRAPPREALPTGHPPVADPRADTDAATTLFRVMCAECHGPTGRGDGPRAMGRLPDFSDPAWQRRTTDARIAEAIAQGSPRGMPSFGKRLAPAAIEALVRYVRSLSRTREAASTPEPSGPEANRDERAVRTP